jgi:hypothetical protein
MAIPNRYRVTVLMLAMVLAAGLLVAVLAKPAWAEDTECTGVLTGEHENVIVPEGADCTLSGARVSGDVQVREEGTLLSQGATIDGSVLGPNVRWIVLQFETQVGGDVRIKGANAGFESGFDVNVRVGGDALIEKNQGSVFVDGAIVEGNLEVSKNIPSRRIHVEFNTVGGNIKVEKNVIQSPIFMSVLGNQVTGNLQVLKNTGTGSKQVVNNTVSENLQCFDNDPPFVGTPNVAQQAEGQCSATPPAP